MRWRTSSDRALRRSGHRRSATLAVCAALSFALPLPAVAGPAEGPTAAEMFREGQASAAAADYAGAIEHFEAAMRLVAHDPDAIGVRNRMRTELVIAHLKAYDVDGDTAHLRKSSLLLDDYDHDLDPSQVDERAWVAERRAEIAERNAAAKAAAEAASKPQPPPETPAESAPKTQSEPVATAPSPSPTDQDRRDDERVGRNLMFTGGILTGVGVAGGALAIAGFAMANSAVDTFENDPNKRDDARAQNRTGNNMGIAGGIVAGIAVPAGVALLVIGAKRKKRGRSATALLPYAGPDAHGGRSAGLTLRGRF